MSCTFASFGRQFLMPCLAGLMFVGSTRAVEPTRAVDAAEHFENHVRPILVERCQGCHGSAKQWAGLRLDSRAALLQGGDSGPAIVPGDPSASELITRVSEADESLRMPPTEAGPALTREEIAAIKQWIEQGAPWPDSGNAPADEVASRQKEHWAFQPIRRPELPTVKDKSWPETPVDRFIQAKLEAEGLAHAPAADKRTLIRRVTYDLTGLPPTAAEVEAFIADESPDAYRELVERLLSRPAYGEHWGRHWLDVARYSDTKGYVYAREERTFVHAWNYRDWVVRAFNADLPYNRFLLLQLAADQVPSHDDGDLAAMGYITVGRRFIGVTPDIIDDRIDVVSRGLLGLTVGCARCHDHKYDPIPTADYYSLYGVFQSSCERLAPIPKSSGADGPSDAIAQDLAAKMDKLAETLATRRTEAANRIRERIGDYLAAQLELDKYPELGFDQVLAKEDLIPATVRRWQAYLSKLPSDDPIFAPWRAYVPLSDQAIRESGATIQAKLSDIPLHPRIAEAFAKPPASAAECVRRYTEVFQGVLSEWQGHCEAAKLAGQPEPTRLQDAAAEALRQVLFAATSPCVVPDEPIVNIESYFDSGTVNELWGLQRDVDRILIANGEAVPYATVLADRDFTVQPQIFRRGNPANKGEVVPRQFLAVIAGANRQPFQHGSGRRELAEAIINPSNPLTARVWVNRVWLHHFGSGLVTTPSDFGLRADPPSHPDLLDWLASELMASGWSTKTIHRAIVLSATYQQSSTPPASEALSIAKERDPRNRWLWRQNPRRLSFEQYHDTLVSVSGELNPKVGGTAVELFSADAGRFRRALYGRIDRQFLPAVLRVFDFANPDLHSPQRLETNVPQQALFLLNHPFVAGRSRALARIAQTSDHDGPEPIIRRLYERLYQRVPTDAQIADSLAFLQQAQEAASSPSVLASSKAWSYGYGRLDEKTGSLTFTSLPHFDGAAWQGGPKWPDVTLGWAQLTANGGHAGNDLDHAVVRRWTAEKNLTVSIESELVHNVAAGDGVRGWIVSSRQGVLVSATVHNKSVRMDLAPIDVQTGDTLSFVVDINGNLNSDQFEWAPRLTVLEPALAGGTEPEKKVSVWDAERDFSGPRTVQLSPVEQLAQLLLISNEAMFID